MTRQQRIAREWLIFLGCIIAGLLITYFAVYSSTPVYQYKEGQGGEVFMKYKNPGDMFNDLLSPFEGYGHYRRMSHDFGVAWLLTLSPYLTFSLLRSILWSVRTLQEKPPEA
jgi:hypothetical protein